jgi:hypothetical protein
MSQRVHGADQPPAAVIIPLSFWAGAPSQLGDFARCDMELDGLGRLTARARQSWWVGGWAADWPRLDPGPAGRVARPWGCTVQALAAQTLEAWGLAFPSGPPAVSPPRRWSAGRLPVGRRVHIPTFPIQGSGSAARLASWLGPIHERFLRTILCPSQTPVLVPPFRSCRCTPFGRISSRVFLFARVVLYFNQRKLSTEKIGEKETKKADNGRRVRCHAARFSGG